MSDGCIFFQVELCSGYMLWVCMVVSFHPIVYPVVLAWWAGAKLAVAKSTGPSGMLFFLYSLSCAEISFCTGLYVCPS